MKPYTVWSFENAIRDGGDDAFPDRIAAFARAVLAGDEAGIRVAASELGIRAHPCRFYPKASGFPHLTVSLASGVEPMPRLPD